MAKNGKSVPLTDDQKVRILQMDAEGAPYVQIKKELGIENGQQISGVLFSQYTPTGQYLLKKAGLAQPTRPPKKLRSDLVEPVETPGADAIRNQLEPAPQQVPAASGAQPNPVVLPLIPTEPIADGSNRHLEPLRPVTPRPALPSSGGQNAIGFVPDGKTVKYIVFRETPFKAQIGTFTPPWDVTEIAPRFGDGDYVIQKWLPGRTEPEVMRLPVAGYGAPRQTGYGENPMNSVPQEPPSATANAIVNAIKAGAELTKQQQPAPLPPPEQKPLDRAAEQVMVEKLKEAFNPPPPPKNNMDEFMQNWLRVREDERKEERLRREQEQREREEQHKRERQEREEQYKREQREREEEHKRRMEESDRKHQQEMERIRAEAIERRKADEEASKRREELDRKHEAAMAEINSKKLDWAMKKSQEAVEEANAAIAQSEEKLAKKVDELNMTASKERERDRIELQKERDFLLKEIEAQKDQLKLQREFQEQLIELRRSAASQNDNKLMELGQQLLNAFNDRAKDVLEVQKARAVLDNNPNMVGDALKNPQFAAHLAGGSKKPQGDGEMANQIDRIAGTEEFRAFMEDWCNYVDEEQDAGVLFDSIQRRYQNGEAGIGELVDFIAGRKWAKAKLMIWKHLPSEQQTILSRPYGEKFYENVRAHIILMKAAAMRKWRGWESGTQPIQPEETPAPEVAPEAATEAPVVSEETPNP